MTDRSTPPVFARVLPLLKSVPDEPDFEHGYLDLLSGESGAPSGPIQSFWESGPGSGLYDHVQSIARRVAPAWYRIPARSRPPEGGRVLDIGCGPGNATAALGRQVGPGGLAIGLDISRPMLARAARAETSDNVGFVRADARDLPFSEGTFDLVTSFAALQLIPAPEEVLVAACGALVPGGWLAVMVPTPHDGFLHVVSRLVGDRTGLAFFDPDQIAEQLDDAGMRSVHTHRTGPVLWINAQRPA
ncbi:Ubiquinone/menaquinone biosynthesis C-methylase UbiE [Saccharopolyspora kobensis]|uniref:Ubiquinone/menaquinone biosynthesis C-methylase UbiE n=1 Tax=Saccharopolyspora kobensis TaxID=146035 RepID=A0A1H5Y2N6_9PSEU|nr:methyltransferase domain-containing protein [Saccharopolyspora kobensis]SEG18274.1 Ubiquinone/menaquinone biosynthesis C-methylase UbiE [Saccharopolyspora kobensis]SFF09147.1 Ubiquinone/menaquinone biosynthesis C-methylase UbiE [Saccharopolyspora kobensis]